MTTPKQIRCKKCSYLKIDEDGNWVCTGEEENKNVQEIEDEDCPVEQEY